MNLKTMYPPQKDSPSTFLTGNISSSDTLVSVGNASILPQTVPFPLTIGIDKTLTETVMVTAINPNNNQLTISRGPGALEWTSGSRCGRVFNAYDLEAVQYNVANIAEQSNEQDSLLISISERLIDAESDIITNKTETDDIINTLIEDLESEVTRATNIENDINTNKVNRSELAQVITDWTYNANGTELTLAITRYNASNKTTTTFNKTIPLVNNVNVGIMTPEAYNEIASLRSDVNNLINQGGKFIGRSFANKSDLDDYEVPESVKIGDFTYVLDDETHDDSVTRYVYDGINFNFAFVVEQDPIGLADNETPGLVLSDDGTTDGKVFVELDGTMSVVGWDDVQYAKNRADEAFQSASNGKTAITNAITGVDDSVIIPTDPTFQQLADAIGRIKAGIDTSDATVTAENILADLTAYVKDQKIIGTMPNLQSAVLPMTTEISWTRRDSTPIYDVRAKSTAIGKVTPNTTYEFGLQNVVPENVKAGVTVGSGYGFTGTFTNDATATDPHVLANHTYYRQGAKGAGSMPNRGAVSIARLNYILQTMTGNLGLDTNGWGWTLTNASIVANAGYWESGAILNSPSGSHASIYQPQYIVSGHKYYASAMIKKTANGLSGQLDIAAISPELDFANLNDVTVPTVNTWTLVSGVGTAQMTGNGNFRVFTTNQSNVHVDNLMLFDLTFIFGQGKEPTKETIDALLINNGYGFKSMLITEIYQGGYITNSSTGYPLVGKREDNLVKESIAHGKNLFGLWGTFTGDANATANAMLAGNRAYVQGQPVDGTMPMVQGDGYFHYPAHQLDVGKYSGDGETYAYMGVHNGHYLHNVSWIKSYQPHLTPGNIAAGANIFGVQGTLVPGLKYASGTFTHAELIAQDHNRTIAYTGVQYELTNQSITMTAVYHWDVTGLNFTPRVIFIIDHTHGYTRLMYVARDQATRAQIFMQTSAGTMAWTKLSAQSKVEYGGFSMPIFGAVAHASPLTWYAWE